VVAIQEAGARTAEALELEVQTQGGVLSFPGEITAGAQWGVFMGLAPLPAPGVEFS